MIENTSNRPPELHILGGTSGFDRYITDMEKTGQQQLVGSDQLPANARPNDQAYLDLGFTLGAPVDGDPLFRHATLPPGWTRQASDHDMWSYLLDADGARRVAIFYKAAFYDRKAFMRLTVQNEDGEWI